jgi:hypothetical protein
VKPHPLVGTITGSCPESAWLSRMSPSHLVKNRARSSVASIVGAPTWASPVHPFFSKYGVSVGIPCRLPRIVRRIARSNCSYGACVEANRVTDATSEFTTRIWTWAAAPSICTYRKPL